jgi:hypothetical protein
MINRLPTKPYASQSDRSGESGLPDMDLTNVREWRQQAERFISEYPAAVLAVSLGVGFLIGWWKKRK